MKAFLSSVTIAVFLFSSISGASLHSIADLKHENGVMAAKLVTMSIKTLSGVDI